MALIEINWKPTSRQLRQFGSLCLVTFPLLGWIWSGNLTFITALACLGLLMAIIAYVYPNGISPLFVGLMLITAPIGLVLGEVAMFLIYMTVFLPIGMYFRLVSRDRLRLKHDRQASSYWQSKRQPKSSTMFYFNWFSNVVRSLSICFSNRCQLITERSKVPANIIVMYALVAARPTPT